MDDKGVTRPTHDISSRSFAAAFRGFDRAEVRKFLADVAVQQQAFADRAEEAEGRLEELRVRLESVEDLLRAADEKYQAAQEHLEELESRPAEPETNAVAEPEKDAIKAFGEQVTEVLQIAVAAGNSIRAEAESWASQRRQEADEQAANTLASARQEVADIVAREETNVDQLKSTEEALRSWLRAAHAAIGQVLDQPSVEREELTSVMGRIRELGPSSSTDAWSDPVDRDEPVERDEPIGEDEPIERDEPVGEPQPYIPAPTMLSSYFG